MKIIKNKETKHALLSVVLFIAVIALYIELNVLVNKFGVKDFDVSEQQLYSISKESRDIISKIDKKVYIDIIDFDNYKDYEAVNDALEIIHKYAEINGNISISEGYTDVKSDDEEIYPRVIIESGEKSCQIFLDDLFIQKNNVEEGYIDSYYTVEEAITNGICNVVNDNDGTVYIYTDKMAFDENYLYTFATRLQCLSCEINLLGLSNNGDIPQNCECVVMPPLKEDLNEKEYQIIEKYVLNGGNIMFLEESKSLVDIPTPNLDKLRMLFGYEVDEGVIIEAKNHAKQNPGLTYFEVSKNNDVFRNQENKYKIAMVDGTRIKIVEENKMKELNIEVQPIIEGGETTYIRYNMENASQDISEDDVVANGYILGCYIRKKVGDKEAKAIVYSNSLWATNKEIGVIDALTSNVKPVSIINIYDNEEVLTQSVRFLTNNNSILSRKKQKNNIPSVNITKDGVTLKIIFGLPVIILIIGFLVWRHRKNNK